MGRNHDRQDGLTRRDFIKGASGAALGLIMGVSSGYGSNELILSTTRVILIRDKAATDADGKCNAEVLLRMVDQSMKILFDAENSDEAWKTIFKPNDIVGIKSNVWGPLPTPPELEQILKRGVLSAGVSQKNISIGDRGILDDEVFKNASALINVRPLRTHHWAGVGGLLKNYIMFVPEPWQYHDNSCADLAALWNLPIVKGKTRLNVLVMLTPLFHGIGAHHFDKAYTWSYNGLLIGTDPVALDAVGLEILKARRKIYFGEDRPMKPPPHHIAFADTKHKLGTADMSKIDLVKIGWDEDILI